MDENTALEKIIEEYKSIELAKKHLGKLGIRLTEESARLQELSDLLDKEYEDVRQLEQLTLKGLFQKFLGDLEQQYEIEKQEYLQAVLQYKECKKTVELLAFEQRVLQEKVEKESEVLHSLETLIQERTSIVSQKYPKIKDELISISHQLDRNRGYQKELREALVVGLKVEEVLKRMIHLLKLGRDQSDWGVYTAHSRNVYYTNSHLDEAQQLSYRAKQLLQELEDELEDIYAYKSIRRWSKFEEFIHFNDIFYDRLISDWMVQQEISSAINHLVGTLDSINRITATLKVQIKTTQRNIDYLNTRKKEVITEYLE